MDLEKVEIIVAKLAKNGDRETISLVISLLSEISKYKKEEKSSEKSVEKKVIKESFDRVDSHAAAILEGESDSSRVSNRFKPNGEPESTSDMMNHAAALW